MNGRELSRYLVEPRDIRDIIYNEYLECEFKIVIGRLLDFVGEYTIIDRDKENQIMNQIGKVCTIYIYIYIYRK